MVSLSFPCLFGYICCAAHDLLTNKDVGEDSSWKAGDPTPVHAPAVPMPAHQPGSAFTWVEIGMSIKAAVRIFSLQYNFKTMGRLYYNYIKTIFVFVFYEKIPNYWKQVNTNSKVMTVRVFLFYEWTKKKTKLRLKLVK